jgi:hypothetical protein
MYIFDWLTDILIESVALYLNIKIKHCRPNGVLHRKVESKQKWHSLI